MTATPEHLLVLSTCPDAETARRIASLLIEGELAACVNIVAGVQSVYRWQGRIEVGQEQLLIIKTRRDRYAQLEQAVRDNHPYELPEVVAVAISDGLPGYLSWIDQVVKGA